MSSETFPDSSPLDSCDSDSYPLLLIASRSMLCETSAGSYSTYALELARFTTALFTPPIDFNAVSIFPTQLAQRMPTIGMIVLLFSPSNLSLQSLLQK